MITIPIFTRLMTTEQYGVYTVYQSWLSIITILATLNLSGSVINNGMVKYKGKENVFVSSLQGLSFAVTLVVLAVYLLFSGFWNSILDLPTSLVLVMFVQLLFEPAYLMWMQKSRFEFKYKGVVSVTLIIAVLSPCLGVLAVITAENKVFARVFSYALVQVAVGLSFFIFNIIKGKKLFVKEYWKFALAFNIPLVPHYLSQIILGQSDRIMISRMVGSSEAAIYAVAYTIASIINLFINAINSSYIPTLYQNISQKKYLSIKKSSSFLFILMGLLVCVVMMLGPEIMFFLASADYYEAIYSIPPVAASVFFTYTYTIFVNIEFYYEKTTYTMWISMIGAVVNIILNYYMIPRFGYIAAGYTTLASYLLFCLGHAMLSRYLLGKNGIRFSKIFDVSNIAILSIVVMVIALLTAIFLYNYTYMRWGIIIIIIVGTLVFRKKIIQYFKEIMGKN